MGSETVMLSRVAGPRENREGIIILSPYIILFISGYQSTWKKEVDLMGREINANSK